MTRRPGVRGRPNLITRAEGRPRVRPELPPSADLRPSATSDGDVRSASLGGDARHAFSGGGARPACSGTGTAGTNGRDRGVDTARAMAMAGVVVGHWLVTGLVMRADGLHTTSPLATFPQAAPVSWFLQTLGLFFFAGGFAATRAGCRNAAQQKAAQQEAARQTAAQQEAARQTAAQQEAATGQRAAEAGHGAVTPRGGAAPTGQAVLVRRRVGRTWKGVMVLLGSWMVVLFFGAAAGVSGVTLATAGRLAVSPLWFLVPYFALLVITPVLRRCGIAWLFGGAGVAVAVVAALDCAAGMMTFGRAATMSPSIVGGADNGGTGHFVAGISALPAWAGYLAVAAAWAVPWCLGVAVARGRLAGRRHAVLLAVMGSASLVTLVGVGGYPVSAVGVPGAGRSNLDPPSLAAIALAVAQVGVFLLLRPIADRPWRWVAALNRYALPVYLWHQSVLLVTAGAAVALGLPGMIGTPGDTSWVAWRVAWLPVLAVVLAVAVHSSRVLRRRRSRADEVATTDRSLADEVVQRPSPDHSRVRWRRGHRPITSGNGGAAATNRSLSGALALRAPADHRAPALGTSAPREAAEGVRTNEFRRAGIRARRSFRTWRSTPRSGFFKWL
ncbi:acyltransferase family protein [Symbioplanes lichenis]|uniref:acyltransferase family protein n=1 Tax=Symbioplanes lichenis TaxID=1629072 RepID=UPI00273A4992|nr:acyltransferase [Actinoplanes lichenis]